MAKNMPRTAARRIAHKRIDIDPATSASPADISATLDDAGKAHDGKRRRYGPKARAYALRRFIAPLESKRRSMEVCGYAPGTSSGVVERTGEYQDAMAEIKAMAAQCQATPTDQLRFFAGIRDGKAPGKRQVAVSASVEAAKELNRMLGYHAPERHEVQQSSVNVLAVLHEIRASGGSVLDLIKAARSQGVGMDAGMDGKETQGA